MCFARILMRFAYEIVCFLALIIFPYYFSCFWPQWDFLVRFYAFLLHDFLMRLPYEIFMLFGRNKISLWGFMHLSCIIILWDVMVLDYCEISYEIHAFWALRDSMESHRFFYDFEIVMRFPCEIICCWLHTCLIRYPYEIYVFCNATFYVFYDWFP